MSARSSLISILRVFHRRTGRLEARSEVILGTCCMRSPATRSAMLCNSFWDPILNWDKRYVTLLELVYYSNMIRCRSSLIHATSGAAWLPTPTRYSQITSVPLHTLKFFPVGTVPPRHIVHHVDKAQRLVRLGMNIQHAKTELLRGDTVCICFICCYGWVVGAVGSGHTSQIDVLGWKAVGV